MGQVCQITDQEGNDEYFYYDEEGSQETHIDRNGNVERTLYNMDGNLAYRRFEDRKGRNPVVNRYVYYSDGKLREAAGGGITYCYTYTENGLLKNKSDSGKTLLEYDYDRNRNLTSLADSMGNIVYYSYDMLNRLKRVSGGREDVLAVYDYTGAGQIRSLRYGNGVQTEYRYQDDGELSGLVTLTEQGQVLLNFDYAYDGNGNCVRKSGETYQNKYAYDHMNRLVSAVQDGQEEKYAYDLVGNRLKKESAQGIETYCYNDQLVYGGFYTNKAYNRMRFEAQPGDYQKHVKATTMEQAIELSQTQAQYIPGIDNNAWEYKAMFEGIPVSHGNGTIYYFYDTGQIIGFDGGLPTTWIRAELSSGFYHGHPISTKRVGKYITIQ